MDGQTLTFDVNGNEPLIEGSAVIVEQEQLPDKATADPETGEVLAS